MSLVLNSWKLETVEQLKSLTYMAAEVLPMYYQVKFNSQEEQLSTEEKCWELIWAETVDRRT